MISAIRSARAHGRPSPTSSTRTATSPWPDGRGARRALPRRRRCQHPPRRGGLGKMPTGLRETLEATGCGSSSIPLNPLAIPAPQPPEPSPRARRRWPRGFTGGIGRRRASGPATAAPRAGGARPTCGSRARSCGFAAGRLRRDVAGHDGRAPRRRRVLPAAASRGEPAGAAGGELPRSTAPPRPTCCSCSRSTPRGPRSC